jgi:mono/diheme cytochrome c family protein
MPRRTLICSIALVWLGVLSMALPFGTRVIAADDTDERISQDDAKKLKSPVPYSKESVARGAILYRRDCTECHGADGKSQVDVIANATDLTDPEYWASGTTEGEVYRSIRDGAGDAMPPFKDKVSKDEELWDMVNYVRSLWPESARPKLVD